MTNSYLACLHPRYEEESLGVFKQSQEDEDEEQTLEDKTSRYERIGKYVGLHLRRQVALDTWWLAWGIFFTCIIERGQLMDPEKASWFNIPRISKSLISLLTSPVSWIFL
jgi:hypothetical protein